MAKKLRVGDTLRGYRVTKVVGPGAMAISYVAQSGDGRKIFLKQYKSPAPTVIWYAPFVDYQQELAARVRAGKASHYAVRLVDAFEERWGGVCYFQAYEFVEHGADLGHMLDEERARHERTRVSPLADPATWAQHVTWAKVLMAGIAALHESGIAHADLKPANAYLIRDSSIGAGYQLKLIDMDFSVLVDRRAPWHGHQGYVGTDNYRSPEHLTRGRVPGLASDVFTCGLILHELLCGEHPYWRDDQEEYARLVRAHAATAPRLAGVMPAPATNAETSAALHRALSPDPAARPTAAELRAVLSGRGARRETVAPPGGAVRPTSAAPTSAAPATIATAAKAPTPASPATPAAPSTTARRPATPARKASPAATPAVPSAGTPLTSTRLQLIGSDGTTLTVGVRTELGKHLVRRFGDESEFWDNPQCVLERLPTGRWQVTPLARTTNETLLNGDVVTEPRPLKEEDVLAVGRKAKGIVKLPLTIRAR